MSSPLPVFQPSSKRGPDPLEFQTHFYDYELPQSQIAQHPAEQRDQSRLLVVKRYSDDIEHQFFYTLKNYLKPGDVVVLNDTKVMKARLKATKETGAKIELFIHHILSETQASALVRPSKRVGPGTLLILSEE